MGAATCLQRIMSPSVSHLHKSTIPNANSGLVFAWYQCRIGLLTYWTIQLHPAGVNPNAKCFWTQKNRCEKKASLPTPNPVMWDKGPSSENRLSTSDAKKHLTKSEPNGWHPEHHLQPCLPPSGPDCVCVLSTLRYNHSLITSIGICIVVNERTRPQPNPANVVTFLEYLLHLSHNLHPKASLLFTFFVSNWPLNWESSLTPKAT